MTDASHGGTQLPVESVQRDALAALVQQVLASGGAGALSIAPLLPMQFPSLGHLDERHARVVQRALDIEGLSSKTVGSYRSVYKYFREFLRATNAERAFCSGQLSAQRRVLEDWIAWLRNRGVNHTTVNSYWRNLHAPLARIAREDGVVDPTRYVATPKPGKSLPEFLTRDALETVFRFVRNYQWPHGAFERARNIALLAVMGLAGCRLGEVLRMQVEDVDCGARTIRVKRGKGPRGGKPRVICMAPALVAAMTSYLDLRADRVLATDRVFVSVVADQPIHDMTIRRLCKIVKTKTGIHVAPHLLRHTCATLMRQEGISDRLSMEQLGHASLDVLQRYSHVAPGERQEAIARFAVDVTGDNERLDLLASGGAGITEVPGTFSPR